MLGITVCVWAALNAFLKKYLFFPPLDFDKGCDEQGGIKNPVNICKLQFRSVWEKSISCVLFGLVWTLCQVNPLERPTVKERYKTPCTSNLHLLLGDCRETKIIIFLVVIAFVIVVIIMIIITIIRQGESIMHLENKIKCLKSSQAYFLGSHAYL